MVRATDHVFAVVDDAAAVPAVIAALVQAGIPSNDMTLLRGAEGASRIDATGGRSGLAGRLRQAMSFTLTDQMPDFALYEAALRDGRAVLGIPIESEPQKDAVARVLRERGAHFANYYGRYVTEELDAWRGPELDLPSLLRR